MLQLSAVMFHNLQITCQKWILAIERRKHVYIKGKILKYTRERKAFKSDIEWNVNIRQYWRKITIFK